jgi:hypothetical protein
MGTAGSHIYRRGGGCLCHKLVSCNGRIMCLSMSVLACGLATEAWWNIVVQLQSRSNFR